MKLPNDFIVGFGLDYDQLGRNLPDVYALMVSGYKFIGNMRRPSLRGA
jgi:hypoxanthine phosphoribosyltransferase